MKAKYVKKLLNEYADKGLSPIKIKINNDELVVPVEYALNGKDMQKSFLRDYFDLQKKELDRYKAENIKPKTVELNGVSYIVPFKWRNRQYKDTQVVEFVLKKAKAKYYRAIALTDKLDKIYPERKYTVEVGAEHVDDMKKAYNHYLLNKCVDKSKYPFLKAWEMISSSGRLMKGKNSAFDRDKLKRSLKRATIGGLIIGGAVFAEIKILSALEKNKIQDKKEVKSNSSKEDLQKVFDLTMHGDFADLAEFVEINEKEKLANKMRSEDEKTKLFNRFVNDVFENEGGYGDEKTIDQPTNMGIIQPTLNAFIERYPDLAEKHNFDKNLKNLIKDQAKLIYRKLYFDEYKIGDYKNESIGLLLFDAYVNHSPETVRKFIGQALKAAQTAGADVNLPSSSREIVNVVNSLSNNQKAEVAFYNEILETRLEHMLKKTNNGTSRLAQGLQNRVSKYEGRFIPTSLQGKKLAMSKSKIDVR